jgi:uncharacterized membrane protein YvbJ
MFCPNCGKELSEGATFCPFCGTKIEERKAIVAAEKPTQKGFFVSLFDFSFKEFISLKLLKILYIIGILFNGLIVLFWVLIGFKSSIATGVILLIFSPLIFLILTILARVWIEALAVAFRIAENTKIIAENTKKE